MKQLKYKVIILDEAKDDIIEAKIYYKKILKKLSIRFAADVKSAVSEIRINPLIFGFRFEKFRTANLSVFPYQVHYILDEANATILIFAVLHAYRNPDFIKIRFRK